MNESPPPSTEQQSEPARAARKPARAWLWWLLAAVMSAGAYYHYDRYQERKAQEEAAKKEAESKKGFGKGMGGPTPVVAVPARTGRIDVNIDALGTVTPLRTVTVRSRVEGQLMRVHFREGELVTQGQLLAEIDPRPFQVQLKNAEGQLARDQALLANAKLDVERYRVLLAQDSIAKQLVDAQEAQVKQFEGVVRSDQSQVENARLQLTYARITAPISGRVGLRLVDPGNIVRGGDATGIVVIAELSPIGVVFTVPQDNLPAVMKRVQSGDRLVVEAWDREQKNRLARGRLLAVDNLVDVSTGSVKLKATFRNDDDELFPNQFVNVRLKLETLEDQTVIQQSAVQRGGRGLFVYVVRDNMTVTARPVTLGAVDGARVAVLKGIEPGDRVVIDGIDRLREGMRVQVTKRPEFKPTVDGTSGARKKGKSKGKGADKGAAPGAEPAGAPGDPAAKDGARRRAAADAADGDDPPAKKKGRRNPAPEGDAAKGAKGGSDAAAEGDAPPKKKRRARPPEDADAAGAPGAEGDAPPKKKRRARPPEDADAAAAPGAEGDAPKKKPRRKPAPDEGAQPAAANSSRGTPSNEGTAAGMSPATDQPAPGTPAVPAQ